MNSVNSKAAPSSGAKVLITDTNRWALAARLAIALTDAGCQVSALCPVPGHALLKTRAVHRTFPYSGLSPLQSLMAAIEVSDPDIVVPSCDRGVGHLHELHAMARARGAVGHKLQALIERSLGSPASYVTVSSRYDLLKMAREEGVRVPSTARINTAEELASWGDREPFPWVLKVDGTWGGGGVRVVQDLDDVENSLTQLKRLFRIGKAVKRLVVNRDSFWFRPWWKRAPHDFIAQAYIEGRPANCAVFCWQGRILASIGVEVVSFDGSTGPASVVRVVESDEMMWAAERLAARLNLSGFFGLDFMIEEGSGIPYLIEMNPRTTPLCHLRLGPGRDPAAALWAQLAGQPTPVEAPVTRNKMIAYFPQAWNGSREMLASSFHDVPQGEPELVEELLRPWPDRTLLFRLFNHRNRKPETSASSLKAAEDHEIPVAVSALPENVRVRSDRE
jgi:predicted ATP-grasp superfamily ATP-dependent carboligase